MVFPDMSSDRLLEMVSYFYSKACERIDDTQMALAEGLKKTYRREYGVETAVSTALEAQRLMKASDGSGAAYHKILDTIRAGLAVGTREEARKVYVPLLQYSDTHEEHQVVVLLTAAMLERLLGELLLRMFVNSSNDWEKARAAVKRLRGHKDREKEFAGLAGVSLEEAIGKAGFSAFYFGWGEIRELRNRFIHGLPFVIYVSDADKAFEPRERCVLLVRASTQWVLCTESVPRRRFDKEHTPLMATDKKNPTKDRIALVLGAGASRSVSYAHEGEFPSPLDSDFFDLLQRLPPRKLDAPAVKFVLESLRSLPHEYRRSMERAFYTLHLRAFLSRKLGINPSKEPEEEVVRSFARCIQALLRKSHLKQVCENHSSVLKRLHSQDVVISFNYDLVAERALRGTAEKRSISFGKWVYGLAARPANTDLPPNSQASWEFELEGVKGPDSRPYQEVERFRYCAGLPRA
ncbi:MAG: hypothetical protein L0387_45945 [Acidobacteria bacterium]|nr:hypothetical protein [Acidobacteriota bacterium]